MDWIEEEIIVLILILSSFPIRSDFWRRRHWIWIVGLSRRGRHHRRLSSHLWDRCLRCSGCSGCHVEMWMRREGLSRVEESRANKAEGIEKCWLELRLDWMDGILLVSWSCSWSPFPFLFSIPRRWLGGKSEEVCYSSPPTSTKLSLIIIPFDSTDLALRTKKRFSIIIITISNSRSPLTERSRFRLWSCDRIHCRDAALLLAREAAILIQRVLKCK